MSLERDERPWGFYEVLANESNHKVKRITVKPNRRLSLQSHQQRGEHWFVLFGRALVTRGAEEIALGSGQSIDIPQGEKHRIANAGDENLVFIEVQHGDYFGEDDIKRFEDDFGRN